MPPRTKDFLTNFGETNETKHHRGTQFEEPIPGPHHSGTSSQSGTDSPARESYSQFRPPSLDSCTSPARSPPSTELRLRARSESPPAVSTMTPPIKIDLAFGRHYELNQLESIRFTSYYNPRRQFELRRYTFPANKPLRKLLQMNVYAKMPTEEQIVLSTIGGDVFATLETSETLSGIYSHYGRRSGVGRMKINIHSGEVTPLKKDEIREVPVGRSYKILFHFQIEVMNDNLTRT